VGSALGYAEAAPAAPGLIVSRTRRYATCVLGACFRTRIPAAVTLVALHVPAQGRQEALVEITRADALEVVEVMAPFQHGCVPLGKDGALVLVHRDRFIRPLRPDVFDAELELWQAADGGARWRKVAVTPTSGDADGAIARDGDLLAVCWTASNGNGWTDAWFQRFDPARESWIGEPERLTDSTGVKDQFVCSDLARAGDGSLVAVIGCHRAPPAQARNSVWSTGVRILPQGRGAWTAIAQVNEDGYGVCGNALARGDVVDVTFRALPFDAVHGLRRIDAAQGRLADSSAPITPSDPGEDDAVANVGILCGDDVGRRTLLFLRGNHRTGKGRLSVALDRGDGAFAVRDLADDPALCSGDETNTTFTLARGPGNLVYACFAKVSDKCPELWQATIADGEIVQPARVVARGAAYWFAGLNGMREPSASSTLRAVAVSRAEAEPGGVVRAFGAWPIRNVALR